MDTTTQITIRTKKLGVLIRDASLSARRSVQECAEALGVRKSLFRSYEEGTRSPSLPELEALVFYLGLPLDHFWSKQIKSASASPIKNIDLPKLLAIRQRKIGALLRQERMAEGRTKDEAAHWSEVRQYLIDHEAATEGAFDFYRFQQTFPGVR